ncbi:putative glyoxalase superfamily protein PhnB [Herbihabitans rhizosphaerae]|uniref:Putative glyoxalase superfamily protein PhnB n=1 Tax=Herbihabitans rhizosphaerae TaxID=1872711 RepID=A0A4Q7KQA9_9PSEU|nr:VOC family protein [Herbihabitans rhizosphaerae]RZS37881.1 putative glyoxalase superfamily protein PhnB [Herbihabitans rhizosphaerae]
MSPVVRTGADLPSGERTLNPFAIVDGAADLITFVQEVFDGVERAEARTPMPSGSLIHAEVAIGDSVLLLADAQPGWPVMPALLQVYVRDAQEVLDRAVARGAAVITEVTPFYGGEDLARLRDPWGNIWWLYAPAKGAEAVPSWEGGSTYMFDSLDAVLRERAGAGK